MPVLILLFVANLLLVILRDIKEDFLVKIIDMSGHSSWLFAQIDSVVTLIILALFGMMVFVKSNIKVLVILLKYGGCRNGYHEFRITQLRYASTQHRDLVVHPESEPLHCLPLFSKHIFRPLHSMLQDKRKCRILYCDY